jgi:hypothetical protein
MLGGHQSRGKLGPNGSLGRGRILPRSSSFDDLHRQTAPDVAGDQQLLDRIPVRLGWPATQRATQPRHEAAAASLQTRGQISRRLFGGLDWRLRGRRDDLRLR